jgi:RHS repeat-associated protein
MQHLASVGGGSINNWTRLYETDVATSNQLLSTSQSGSEPGPHYSLPYSYDAAGNVTRMPHLGGAPGVANCFWNDKNLLIATALTASADVTDGTDHAYYTYDAAGQRVRKVVVAGASVRRERIHVGGYEVFRHTSGGKVTERHSVHVMDDRRRIALVETKTVDAGVIQANPLPIVRYQHDNHLGSSVFELDGNGQPISREEYHPFGTTSYYVKPGTLRDIDIKRYRYTGKERDDETGLYYHGARYYAPWLGRWCSTDPAGLVDGASLYSYVRNNPVRFVDPDGRAETDTFNFNPNKHTPINEKFNDLVNQRIAQARDSAGIKPGVAPTGEQLATFVNAVSQLGYPRGGISLGAVKAVLTHDARPNKTFIEKYAEKNFDNQAPGDKYDPVVNFFLDANKKNASAAAWVGLRNGLKAFTVGPSAVNPSVAVMDKSGTRIAIGTDKLGHFFAQGYQMLERYFEKGGGEAGRAAAEELSHEQEMGIFGLDSTGVYSFADREANSQGMQFYLDLIADPFMKFDVANYASRYWNEPKGRPNVNSPVMEGFLIQSGRLDPAHAALNQSRLELLKKGDWKAVKAAGPNPLDRR